MKYVEEKTRVEITGTLVKMQYGPIITMVNGKEKASDKPYYQFTVLTEEDKDTADLIRDLYYSDAADNYIPKWVRGEEKPNKDGLIYCNFKSLYDIKIFYGGDCYNFADFVQLAGGTAPLGSKVTFSVVCKPGALYIAAIRIDKLKKATASDFFS